MSKRCPKCNEENREQARYCMNCNYDLTLKDTPVRLCPSGRHSMDISWTTCPYCPSSMRPPTVAENLESTPVSSLKRPPTVKEEDSSSIKPSSIPPLPPPPSQPSERKTTFDDTSKKIDISQSTAEKPVSSRSSTRFSNTSQESSISQNIEIPRMFPVNPNQIAPYRRIVGILISYTWKSEGQVFPIREGRNYIGRDNDCEISLPEDSQMSSRHTTIICRDGRTFIIDDEKSMNGTFLNDISVEEKQQLLNYSKIKTGSTLWTFIAINPEVQ